VDAFDRQRCRRRAVERFSRDRMVGDHLALYERVSRPPLRERRAEPPSLVTA
jgi:hypothetical protein